MLDSIIEEKLPEMSQYIHIYKYPQAKKPK